VKNKKMMKKIAILLLVLLMISGLSSVTVTAINGTAAEEPMPAGAKGANLSVSNPQLPADMKNWPPISELPTSGAMPDRGYGAINPSYRISDSPCLQLPGDMADWQPIVPPEPHEVEGMRDPTAVEIYDVATGVITRIPSMDKTQQPLKSDLNTTPPYQGLLPSGVYPESVIPPDDRARISPTTSYPWQTICKLFVTWPDGDTGWCSGAIIGCPDGHGYHVLTAGHCVYSHTHGGWATSVMVVPGLDEDYMPYNYAWDTLLRSYTGWTVSGDHRHDWALVTLDRNVGDFTGWMGRMTADPSNSIYTDILNTAGYPCNVYDPSSCPYPKTPVGSMWYDWDYGDYADDYNHWYYMDTQGGQSGSPVWRYVSSPEARYILTIHAYSIYAPYTTNHGTRLNQDKFDRIITWCNADTSPTDYADLIDDGDSWSGFTPTAVNPGDYFSVWCDVRNVGTAASGGFYVSYYASKNTYISTSDYLIGTDYVSSISPFTYGNSGWSGSFPSIPDGTYYIGWIIDSGSDVTEFDEGNNKAYKTYKLVVGLQDAVAFRNGWWYVSNEAHTGTDWTKTFKYGLTGDKPVIGDIDNNGIEDAVIFRNGWWYVSNAAHTGTDWTKTFKYGLTGDKPVIGDIDNNGIEDAVIFRNGWWYVSNAAHTGTDWTKTFKYGIAGDKPVIGDIDNDGIVDAVIYRNGWWYVSNVAHTGTDWTKTFKYGLAGDKPVIGDIDNDGIVDAVIYRNGWWYVSNAAHTGTDWTKTFSYGVAGDIPVVGNIG
jgi:glutamyl endopeptidase